MFINKSLSPVLKVSSGLNQVFLVLHGAAAFLMLDKHLVNQSWRVKLSYAAVSSPYISYLPAIILGCFALNDI